jgi:phosphatidylinositol-3-phosphatase
VHSILTTTAMPGIMLYVMKLQRNRLLIAPVLAVTILLSCSATAAPPLPPRYDHVVMVIEENHSAAQVMGSPYLSSLASRGASFSSMYGITHPSQPNYIALFSGSTQGVADDYQHDISAPNLATGLVDAGLTFATYSEGLPSVGSTAFTAGRYVCKHNPCASFTNVPAASNRPFSSYPSSDYTKLPTVSFVIPNLDNDMHDGSVAAGDAWLQANLDEYASWAISHNSLLIVTFDECAGSDPVLSTPIATIFVGASVRQGETTQWVTLYSLLRVVEDMYGLPYIGDEATAPPIVGIWG